MHLKNIGASLVILFAATACKWNEQSTSSSPSPGKPGAGKPAQAGALQDGDIVFQDSSRTASGGEGSGQAIAIKTLTHSDWSHCGIVFIENGQPYVYEATATVRSTPLAAWKQKGVGGVIAVKRLQGGLTPAQASALKQKARSFLGRGYDVRFEWEDAKQYCSEYVWKVYDRGIHEKVGQLQKWGDFDWRNPIATPILKRRFPETNGVPPVNETIVSPEAILASGRLEKVR